MVIKWHCGVLLGGNSEKCREAVALKVQTCRMILEDFAHRLGESCFTQRMSPRFDQGIVAGKGA